jgi:exodeoxyribonuclease-5
VIWSAQQETAIKEINKWVKDRYGKQIFRLFGYAGTGKTTLINEIANEVNGDVLYMAFTGKAALVMRKKGCLGNSGNRGYWGCHGYLGYR